MLIVKMLRTKPIAVGVRVRPALSLVERTAYRACSFAMEFNIVPMDQMKLDAKLKMVKVKKELDVISEK
jgi:hypothetical protein